MKNYKKSEKGITIMVLVITITVMIILSAVSVKIATGNSKKDGVIQMTVEQKQDQFDMVTHEGEKINAVIENENDKIDWGY